MKKYAILKVLFPAICLNMQAQQQTKAIIDTVFVPRYEFINYDVNNIQVPGKKYERMNGFFQKIDNFMENGTGRVNILHIGGSHVQADMFPHQVRQNLDVFNGDCQPPRGLIFPFRVAKTNNPTNYSVSFSGVWESATNVQRSREVPLGMSGIAVYTKDPSAQITVSLNTDKTTRYGFNHLHLIGGHSGDDSHDYVTPVLYHNDEIIEGFYDFLTTSYVFDLPEMSDNFTMGFIQSDTTMHKFIVNGFIPENDVPAGIVYHSIGVNGASVPSYLRCEYFDDELHLLNLDMVIFAIGINDAASRDFSYESFYNDYKALLEKIERVNPDCAFIFITNNDSFRRLARNRYQVNTNALVARQVFFQLAREHNAGVWDFFSIMGGLSSMQKWQDEKLAQADKIHFTRPGYLLIGDLFFNAFVNYYKNR